MHRLDSNKLSYIISQRDQFLAHKTTLTPPLFFEVPVPS